MRSARRDVSRIACSKEEKELRQTKAPHYQSHGGGELLLCLDVDCDPGFEGHGEVIVKKRP